MKELNLTNSEDIVIQKKENQISLSLQNNIKNKIDNQQNYSTEETIVGKWIDGSILYRKIIDIGNLPNKNKKNIPHNISNLKRVIKIDGTVFNTVLTPIFPINWYNGYTYIDTYVYGGNIVVEANDDRSAYSGYVELLYIKSEGEK